MQLPSPALFSPPLLQMHAPNARYNNPVRELSQFREALLVFE
jgi:hypothetical protein